MRVKAAALAILCVTNLLEELDAARQADRGKLELRRRAALGPLAQRDALYQVERRPQRVEVRRRAVAAIG